MKLLFCAKCGIFFSPDVRTDCPICHTVSKDEWVVMASTVNEFNVLNRHIEEETAKIKALKSEFENKMKDHL